MMNNVVNNYLVLLQPLAPFFFGGEQGEMAEYFLTGSNFPQQTALLGLLRHQLLIQNGLLPERTIVNISEATDLIGAESFQYNNTAQTFGVIIQLSACYLCFPAMNNDGDEFCTYNYHVAPPKYVNKLVAVNGSYVFPDFSPKDDYNQDFRLLNSAELTMPSFTSDDIFKKNERPGIDKNYDGKPKDDAYYKQVWLSMPKEFSFGVYLSINNNYGIDKPVILKDSYVSFGKESSPFLMTVKKVDIVPKQQTITNVGQNALYLTSDTYVSEDLSDYCEVAVTDTVAFRNIINSVSQKQEVYYNRKPVQPHSKRLQLYKKGSFFYSGNIQSVADKILMHKQFVAIGYNTFQFTTINILK